MALTTKQDLSAKSNHDLFLESLQLVLDAADLHIDDAVAVKAETNTLSIETKILGLAYPRTLEQLQHVVKAAATYKVALYTVSQGKNIGYGEMTPTGQQQFVVHLKYLNTIREFDSNTGEVIIEPGVTQRQLAAFLNEKKAKFWADVTGASPEASIIGNTLEAGFGHTPIGDHRKHILHVEILLADGSILTTAEMPSIGPDLSQLFVQSNFGIVTAMRVPLFPIPEQTLTFNISFSSDENFFKGMLILASLRQDGTISSLLHTGNATRALMTSSRFPQELDPSHVLTEQECHQILNQKSPIDFGMWASIGGLYGYADEVKIKQRRLKKALKGIAKIKFFSDSKLNFLDQLLHSKLALKIKYLNFIRISFGSLKALHGIIRGTPSSLPSDNIFWRTDDPQKLGLMWYAPVIPATDKDCRALIETARSIYAEHQFEMPVTLTLIDSKHVTAVFNISYDKSNPAETLRAHAAYKKLSQATQSLGYLPYRCGLVSQPESIYEKQQFIFLEKLKLALDPQNIFAPGRYGIGIRSRST